MNSLKKEEIEQALFSLLEQGAILGFEVPENYQHQGVMILVPAKNVHLEEKLKELLPRVPLRIIETEPPKAF